MSASGAVRHSLGSMTAVAAALSTTTRSASGSSSPRVVAIPARQALSLLWPKSGRTAHIPRAPRTTTSGRISAIWAITQSRNSGQAGYA
jgi:hypothetical protein